MMIAYNLTDTFWVGKLENNVNAIAATANVFPIIWFISSLSAGFGTACSALVSQYTSRNENEKVKSIIGQISVIMGIFGIIFIFLGLFATEFLTQLLDTPEAIRPDAMKYMRVIMCSMSFAFAFNIFQTVSHARGNSITPMWINAFSVIFNIIVDPILIFGLGTIPAFGLMGAAYATFAARCLTVLLAIYFMFKECRDILPKWKDFAPHIATIKRILKVSIPSSLSQSMTSLGFVVLLHFINQYDPFVCTLNAVNNRFTGIFLAPAMGINSALVAIIGQNIGVKNFERVHHGVKEAIKLMLCIMVPGCLILFFFGPDLARLIINDPLLIAESAYMFRVATIGTFLCSIMFIYSSILDGSGHTILSLTVSILRLWLVRIPVAYILSGQIIRFLPVNCPEILFTVLNKIASLLEQYPYNALWWSMVVSNLFGLILSYRLYKAEKWKESII